MRTYLRCQHAVQRAVLSGAQPTQPPLHPGAQGCFSPDCTKSASLAPGNKLQVRDMFSGHLLHEWDLPPIPAAVCRASSWGWDSRQMTLLYGASWELDGHPSPQGDPSKLAGMVHVDTSTGSTATTRFKVGEASGRGWARASFCPKRDLVVVELGDVRDDETTIHILNSCGNLLRKLDGLRIFDSAFWAPAGQALTFVEDRAVWVLRDLCAGPVAQAASADVLQLAWATPFSGRAALLLWERDEQDRMRATVLIDQQAAIRHHVSQQVLTDVCSMAWGSRLAILATSTELHLYSLAGNTLTLQDTLSPEPGRLYARHPLALSADGALCAAVTTTPGPEHQKGRHLAVVHLALGTLREYAVLNAHLSNSISDQQLCVRWAQDCSVLLVSARDGSPNEVFKFC